MRRQLSLRRLLKSLTALAGVIFSMICGLAALIFLAMVGALAGPAIIGACVVVLMVYAIWELITNPRKG